MLSLMEVLASHQVARRPRIAKAGQQRGRGKNQKGKANVLEGKDEASQQKWPGSEEPEKAGNLGFLCAGGSSAGSAPSRAIKDKTPFRSARPKQPEPYSEGGESDAETVARPRSAEGLLSKEQGKSAVSAPSANSLRPPLPRRRPSPGNKGKAFDAVPLSEAGAASSATGKYVPPHRRQAGAKAGYFERCPGPIPG